MAKNNNNNGVKNKNKNKNKNTNNNDGGEKKEDGSIASKIVKRVKPFQGAESVKSEGQANKLTVVGKVDPTKLRDELATKTKNKNKVDLVSPQPKKDNKVNKDDANDTKKKQPEKTDNDEKPKVAPLKLRNLRVLNRRRLRVLTPSGCTSLSPNFGCDSVSVVIEKGFLRVLYLRNRRDLRVLYLGNQRDLRVSYLINRSNLANFHLESCRRLKSLPDLEFEGRYSVSGNDVNDGNNGNDRNDGNDGNGGGGGEEKKKDGDKGNGGGKMKYPAGQSGFGQFPYETVYRHGYGYQNGTLKMGEKMLLLCCEVFGLLVTYNHLAKDIYTNVTLHTYNGGSIKVQ